MRDPLFLRACRREPTPRPPVWLMRQAGRYMKSYRDIRETTPFLAICKDPALSSSIAVDAQRTLGTDAAILFADILLMVEAFGLPLDYVKGDGPLLSKPVKPSDAAALRAPDPEKSLGYVMEAMRRTRAALAPDVALLGFAGAPYTLAAYMIEGGSSKDFAATKSFLRFQTRAWADLLGKIADATALYLDAQIRAGADAVQIFDSWAGSLTPDEYARYAAPYTKRVIENMREKAPVIHFGTGTAPFLESFAAIGDVLGIDHRIPLDEAWKRVGYGKPIQGNLDPKLLCGPKDALRRETEKILKQAAGRPGFIFNLGHGVLPETPEENAIELVRLIRESLN